MGVSGRLGRRGERKRQAFTLMLGFLFSVTVWMAVLCTKMANARGREIRRKKKKGNFCFRPTASEKSVQQSSVSRQEQSGACSWRSGGWFGLEVYFTVVCVELILHQHKVPKQSSLETDEEKAVARRFCL